MSDRPCIFRRLPPPSRQLHDGCRGVLVALALAAAAVAPDPVLGQLRGPLKGAAPGRPAAEMPGPLAEVGFDQRLGEAVPAELAFTDFAGRPVALGDYFGERPLVAALVYYECPMLCGMVLDGLTRALRTLDFKPGRDFDVLVTSFDPRETPAQAAAARRRTLERYGREPPPGDDDGGWHFLTGDRQAIDRLASTLGFRYAEVEGSEQFAHAAGIVLLTPEGRISRYLYGLEYAPRDLRLGLVEAAGGSIGGVVEKVLLYCFHYDPVTGRYSAAAMNLLRAAAAATVAVLAGFLLLQWRRERRRQPAGA